MEKDEKKLRKKMAQELESRWRREVDLLERPLRVSFIGLPN